MTSTPRLVALLTFVMLLGNSRVPAGESTTTVTSTGWFSDLKCASERVADGRIGPTSRECSQRCLARGVKLAFIDENAKRDFAVDNPKVVKALLGDHVAIEATKPSANSIHVTSVKVLSKYVAKCDVY